MEAKKTSDRFGAAERDLVALGIAAAAIILLVATGGTVLPDVFAALFEGAERPDPLLANALFLNIALIIFGWRRYRELKDEIAERCRAEKLARDLAGLDPLTGCLNRRSMATITQEMRASTYKDGHGVAYCMIDLDNFKQINDMHGHSTGDEVLIELSRRIQKQLPKDAKLARLGGDEFAFVTPFNIAAKDRIDDLVIRLFEQMARPFELGNVTVNMTMSIGLSSDTDDAINGVEQTDCLILMHQADIAMYTAKKQGKNCYIWFEPTMENELRYRNELENGIRKGIVSGEFVPFYEQQVDLETGDLAGFEMLARWQSPQLGLVGPDIFIPIAEDIGLISELSDLLINQAFQDAADWDDSLTLSINISPIQLRDPWFAQKLLKMLLSQNFQPQRLEIEITESCLHENIGMVRSIITSLRNQGVRISLDDFGTGYSSLEQLRSLPFDRLKIDRSFVSELKDPDCQSHIVDTIIALGRGLNMPITAEGIDTEETLAVLRKMGDLKGQGFLYGRPENAEQVRERLTTLGKLVQRTEPLPQVAKPSLDEREPKMPRVISQ